MYSLLKDHRGVSAVALIIIMAVLGTLGYVFSSLVASKHYAKAMILPSQQAFYIANSGIEYGIRYASERGWTTGAALNGLDGMVLNLGQGQFTLDYDEPTDTFYSTGDASVSQRKVALENFTSFVSAIQCIELVSSIDPPAISGIPVCSYIINIPPDKNSYVRFYIRNICSSQPTITLTDFQATWTKSQFRLNDIWFDGVLKFSGTYTSSDPWTAFNQEEGTQDVGTCDGARCQGVEFLVKFSKILDLKDDDVTTFFFEFRDTNGAVYIFYSGGPQDC
ncbi:MAG TPA: hypothetical protein VMW42_10890 [Desulfatiglandales bacterium]|nr:hypothetical protein [Desulfatiglandales bacterium]